MTDLDGGLIRFNELKSWARVEQLIADGEVEGLHLEAKAPREPRLTKDQKEYLARAVSGFGNTAGGVILWGVSTTKHEHAGLDVLTQLEPIGHAKAFLQQVERALPTLTTPPIVHSSSRLLLAKPGDTRGIVVTHVPHHPSAPVLTNRDHVFYWRSGDEFVPAPYEVIRRLFAATDSPDLHPTIDGRLVKSQPDGSWRIPLSIENRASAVAERVAIFVTIDDPSLCEMVQISNFQDQSEVNPGRKTFTSRPEAVMYHHLNTIVGVISVKMKVGKRPRRRLPFTVSLYASKMEARTTDFVVQLAKKGFSVRKVRTKTIA